MGMKIDTVVKWLKIQRQNLVDFHEIGRDKKIESLDTAMSYLEDYQQLMRKYERIVEIVKEWREVGLDYDSCDAMDNIERVIEDGKIDKY